MAIALKRTNTIANNGIKILVHSGSGDGKTTLMGTAPNPIIISAESGLLSLRGKDIPYIEVHNMDELYEAYNYVISPEGQQFETICLDSISEIAEIVLAKEKEKSKDPRQAYGTLIDVYLKLLRCFRDIPNKNVVFSCKRERLENSDGTTMFMPSLPGKQASNQTAYFFDEVFTFRFFENQETGKLERWLQTSSDGMYLAKDRSGCLAMFERPDLTEIINKIKGENV